MDNNVLNLCKRFKMESQEPQEGKIQYINPRKNYPKRRKKAKSIRKHFLTIKQEQFCINYVQTYSAVQSMMLVNPKMSYSTAAASGSRALKKPWIRERILEMERELGKTTGLPRVKVLLAHKAIAFSNIADIYRTWTELKNLDDLTEEQKYAIAEIDTKVVIKKGVRTEYVKLKMHDKVKALEDIARMLGYNEPDRLEIKHALVQLNLTDKETLDLLDNE